MTQPTYRARTRPRDPSPPRFLDQGSVSATLTANTPLGGSFAGLGWTTNSRPSDVWDAWTLTSQEVRFRIPIRYGLTALLRGSLRVERTSAAGTTAFILFRVARASQDQSTIPAGPLIWSAWRNLTLTTQLNDACPTRTLPFATLLQAEPIIPGTSVPQQLNAGWYRIDALAAGGTAQAVAAGSNYHVTLLEAYP